MNPIYLQGKILCLSKDGNLTRNLQANVVICQVLCFVMSLASPLLDELLTLKKYFCIWVPVRSLQTEAIRGSSC